MKNVLIGCGVFIALVVVTGIVGTVLFTSWVKKQIPDTAVMDEQREKLAQLYGDREDFVPEVTLAAARVEKFVAVRDSVHALGLEVAGRIADVARTVEGHDSRGFMEKVFEAANVARGGFGAFERGLRYVEKRDRILLELEMGEGEYAFLYALAYLAWLGWNPLDDAVLDEAKGPIGAGEIEEIHAGVRRTFRRQLQNLEGALGARPSRTPEEDVLLGTLREAIAASGDLSFPLRGAVPASWSTTLEHFRERLAATCPQSGEELLLDSIEFKDQGTHINISTRRKQGRGEITVESH